MPGDSDPLDPPKAVGRDRLDRLYGLPRDDFTGARDALAKELRGEASREEGAWVTQLRKPTVAAWATNQLVRHAESEAKALFQAADDLREAQEKVARGQADGEALREASDREREAVSALVEAARDLPGGDALSEAALERVRETLHAITLDEDARRAVEVGRLTHEVAAAGLGLVAGVSQTKPKKSASGRRGGREEEGAASSRARQEERSAKDELGRLEARVREEKRAVSAARKAVREATRDRDRTQKRLDHETGQLEEREERLQRLEEGAKEAKRRVADLRRAGAG